QHGVIDADQLPMRIKGYPQSIEAELLEETEPNIIKKTNSAIEKNLIEDTLKRYDYNRTLTADALHISRKTLFNKMQKHGL
ncbi:MAG: sigma-54-dependent Fis family transcriptional regulator, partial [Prevotellaceae bacterium]|nr:sigma-54-dependent Fis family transcriptional regulator [Prevotellaceae bacterium]